jgi:hypothetical protein
MTDVAAVISAAAPVAEGEFRIGRVFSRTGSVFSRNFPAFFAVTAVATLPSVLISEANLEQPGVAGAVWIALGLVLAVALGTLSQAIVVHGAFQDMRGRRVSLVESLSVAFGRLLPIIGLSICVSVAVALGFLLLVVPGVMMLVMWYVATPACIVEGLGPIASMRRSSALTKGHGWAVFGMMMLIGLMAGIGGAVIKAVLGLAGIAGLVTLGTLVWQGGWGVFSAIFVVVTYHDLRVAKEGIDTEQIAAIFD